MKSDTDLKSDVIAELRWNPAVAPTQIGVAVRDGIVTLSGQVDSYLQKCAAERAVMRVAGVRGIAIDLEVRLEPHAERSDTEIALAAAQALRWHSLVPEDKVRVEVEDGVVSLTGEVDWDYQRLSAEQCVQPLTGVVEVRNLIALRPRAKADNITSEITAALRRHADREAQHIRIEVDGSVVTLSGRVDSLPEHDAAIGTALSTKGVSHVVDRLQIVH